MSLPPPKPLSVSKSPGHEAAVARAATQDAQISQLVQQNRTLEHTLAQLRAQLQAEETRGIDAVNQIRERWKAESKEWRDGCDALQARHRLAHLGTRMALEHERGFRLEDREELIREKTATLLREYKLTLFQARETDLVAQVAALEDEIQSQREEMVDILSRHEAELAHTTIQLTRAEARQQDNVEQVGNFAQEKTELEAEIAVLRTSSSSSAKQIDRLTLQIETLRTQNSSLEARNKELQHQVDKWQSLEGKGEKEAESLRKRRIELEVRVKELEVIQQESRAMGKKIAKLETSLLETQEQAEQWQQDAVNAHSEAAQAQRQAEKLDRQVERLRGAVAAEKARNVAVSTTTQNNVSQSPSKVHRKLRSQGSPVIEPEQNLVESEIEEVAFKPRSRSQKPESIGVSQANNKTKMKDTGAVIDGSRNIPQRGKDQSSGKHREKKREEEKMELESGEIREDNDGSEPEVQQVPSPTKGPDRRQEHDSEIEAVLPPVKKPHSGKPSSRTGKANGTDAEDEDKGDRQRKRVKNKAASTANGQKQSEVDTEEDQPTKKKKRKLNVTGSSSVFSGPAGFTWNQGEEGNLGIPSVLSPVKEGQPVPARSTSSSLLSGWKMW